MNARLAVQLLLSLAVLAGCGATAGGPYIGTPTIRPPNVTPSVLAVDPASGLSIVLLSALPYEATDTVRLIEANGPFPYDQDGAVFENRERILPNRPAGYYHEYTVETPGSSDRGARRLVTGGPGTSEMYYTGDHYDSFQRVAE